MDDDTVLGGFKPTEPRVKVNDGVSGHSSGDTTLPDVDSGECPDNPVSETDAVVEEGHSAGDAVPADDVRSRTVRKGAFAAGAGILLGAIGGMLTSFAPVPEDAVASGEDTDDWHDGDVKVASGVNDGMGFGEAFAAARAEVGPGGAFVWRGGVYGTFTADEWSAMSDAERSEFQGHFAWENLPAGDSGIHGSGTSAQGSHHHVSASSQNGSGNVGETADDVASGRTSGTGGSGGNVSETRQEHPDDTFAEQRQATQQNTADVPSGERELEVIGVFHDPENQTNIAHVRIEGQEVYFVDGDNDMVADVAVVDLNDNGEVDEGEVIDLGDERIRVDSFGTVVNLATGMPLDDRDPVYMDPVALEDTAPDAGALDCDIAGTDIQPDMMG